MSKVPWISVDDMLPNKGIHVLAWVSRSDGYAYPIFARRNESGGWTDLDHYPEHEVTHWCHAFGPGQEYCTATPDLPVR